MEYNVKVWRQKNAKAKGHFETYHVTDVEEDASFLEMLDILNDQLIRKGIEPIRNLFLFRSLFEQANQHHTSLR